VAGHGRCHSALRCLAGRSVLPLDQGDGGRRSRPPGHQGASDRANEVGHASSQLSMLSLGPGLVGGALAAGGRACQHRGARSLHPGRGGRTRLPPRGRLLPASGRLFGLFQDSAEVVGAVADPSGPAEGGGAAAYHPPGTVDAAGSSLGARQARRCPQRCLPLLGRCWFGGVARAVWSASS
jgi:hypothetical protein